MKFCLKLHSQTARPEDVEPEASVEEEEEGEEEQGDKDGILSDASDACKGRATGTQPNPCLASHPTRQTQHMDCHLGGGSCQAPRAPAGAAGATGLVHTVLFCSLL